jgi:transposase
MDLRALARQGSHFSPIGALVGLDRRTGKKHLQIPTPPVYRRPPRPSQLTPFRPLIEPWLARSPGLRAPRIYRDVRCHAGFPGSSPLVPRLIRTRRPPRPVEADGRFETAPGQPAHVDWRDEEPSLSCHGGPV